MRSKINSVDFLIWAVILSLLLVDSALLDPAMLLKKFAVTTFLILFFIYLLVKGFKSTLNVSRLVNHKTFFLVFSAYLILRFISTCLSINFSDGLFEWTKEVMVFILIAVLLLRYSTTSEFLDKSSMVMTVFASIALVMGYSELFSVENEINYSFAQSYHMKSFFGHRNLHAHVLVFTIPFLLYNISRGKLFGWFNSLLFLATSFLLLILYSRAAWLALFISLLISLAVFIYHSLKQRNTDKRFVIFNKRIRLLVTVVSFLLVCGIALFSFIERYELKKQFHALGNWHYGSMDKRIQAWKGTVPLIVEKPVFGFGMSSWKIYILKYISESDISNNNLTFFQRPHNDFLWILSESGIFSVLLYLMLFLYVLYKIKVDSSDHFKGLIIPLMATMGITSYLVISLFSFPKERIEHQVFLSFFIALSLLPFRLEEASHKVKIGKSILALLALTLVLIGSLMVDYYRIRGEFYMVKAFQDREVKNLNGVIANVERAENDFFNMDLTSTPIRWYSGIAQFQMSEIDLALNDFEKAMTINPYNIHLLNNLGSVYYKKGDINKAEEYYVRALNLNSNFVDARFNMAILYYQKDELDRSVEEIQKIKFADLNLKHFDPVSKILRYKVQSMKENEENFQYQDILKRITDDKKWLLDLLKKANSYQIPFEEMVNLDVRYIDENF